MTPGTRPSRRTARAAPLPAFGRAVALSSLTVAMIASSGSIATQTAAYAAVPPGRPPGVHRAEVARLIAVGAPKNKEPRRGCASAVSDVGALARYLGFEGRDAGGQCLVLLAGEARHFLDRLELLAL